LFEETKKRRISVGTCFDVGPVGGKVDDTTVAVVVFVNVVGGRVAS
jgi:hypothetical protein